MSEVVISVENLSKQYRLGVVGAKTLSEDISRAFAKVMKREDPLLEVGDVNDRSLKGSSDFVWALKDVNFDVKRGDVVGIVGKNGAGKSTLLKILSQVTSPTTGSIQMQGRVGSLLEVGTGFHPELTGRENIYINGAILGMRKAEIKQKIDEIIEFAGVEKYIDTPVKRYSSGMNVRLGFSVAAHLDTEILIIDEVLAVGDIDFQKKCIGKMDSMSKGEERTILLVSHNLSNITQLATRSILIDKGTVSFSGTPEEVVSRYIKSSRANILKFHEERRSGLGEVRLESAFFSKEVYDIFEEISFKLHLSSIAPRKKLNIGFSIHNALGETITQTYSRDLYSNLQLSSSGEFEIEVDLPHLYLAPGSYFLKTRIMANGVEEDWIQGNVGCFDVVNYNEHLVYRDQFTNKVIVDAKFKIC